MLWLVQFGFGDLNLDLVRMNRENTIFRSLFLLGLGLSSSKRFTFKCSTFRLESIMSFLIGVVGLKQA